MISLEDIKKLAALARIKLTEAETTALRTDVDAIIEYVSQIAQAPMSRQEYKAHGPHTALREDGESHPTGTFTERLLAAVPKRSGDYVSVKKILNR